MTAPSQGKLLYHLTHISNVSSILKYGLASRNKIMNSSLQNQFVDIADQKIIRSREEHNNHLLDYVLFHFYAKNPFDGAVCQSQGSENMAIITVYRDLHKKQDFYIIPMHPLDREVPKIFSYEEGFKRVRWDILDNVSNRDYHKQTIKNACMAECITESLVQAADIAYVFVYSDKAKMEIERNLGHPDPRIKVAPNKFPPF